MASRKKRNPPTARDVGAAVREYERVHWGERGTGRARTLLAADPRGPLVELGELVTVVYRTRKGGDGLADYHHDFETDLPILAYEPKTKLLVITGGAYHVNTRGIVG